MVFDSDQFHDKNDQAIVWVGADGVMAKSQGTMY